MRSSPNYTTSSTLPTLMSDWGTFAESCLVAKLIDMDRSEEANLAFSTSLVASTLLCTSECKKTDVQLISANKCVLVQIEVVTWRVHSESSG